MKAKHLIVILMLFLSCNKSDYRVNKFADIDVYNEEEINNFIQFFIKNLNDKNDFLSTAVNMKFYGSKLEKAPLILHPERWMTTKAQRDSLINNDDRIFIQQQVNDTREYSIHQKNFKQKILNSDSLKKENLKFNHWQNKKADSLKLRNIQKLKRYISQEMPTEYYNYIKKSTPILHIDKPIFLKNKNRVIFSYYSYTGPLSTYSEIAVYEFKNGKWFKIKTISTSIS